MQVKKLQNYVILARLIFLYILPFYGIVRMRTIWLAEDVAFAGEGVMQVKKLQKFVILAQLISLYALPFYGVVCMRTIWLAGEGGVMQVKKLQNCVILEDNSDLPCTFQDQG